LGRNFAVAVAVTWFVLLAALFLYYQFGPYVIENRAPAYLIASVKVLVILIASAALGLRLLGGKDISLGICLQGLALGLGALAVAGLLISALGLLNPVAVYIVVAVFLAFSYRQALAILRCLRRARMAPLSPVEAAFAAVIAVALLVALINCLSPVTANDALVYHLNLPKIYCAEGAMVRLPYNVYANMPHYGEAMFSTVYSVAGEVGVTLFYFGLLAAVPLAVCSLVTRKAPRAFGIVAASALLLQPLVLDHRVVGNIDILLAFVYLAAIGIALEIRPGGARWRSVVAVSALAGLMVGIKYTGLAPAISLLVLVLVLHRKTLSSRQLAVGILIALGVFLPWLIRQGINTGNPFYPVFERYFDGANWDMVQQDRLIAWQRSMGMGRDLTGYLGLPFNASARGRPGLNYVHFDGTISPVFLLLFPIVFVKRHRETLVLALLAAGLAVFWAFTSQQLRFLLPALALLAAVGAAALSNASGGDGRRAWLRFIFLGILFIEIATLATPNQYGRSWMGDALGERLGAAMGFEPRERFLERSIQPFSLYKQAEASLPPGEPVFMIWENRAYHLERPYFADSFFEASTVMRIVAKSDGAVDLRDRIAAMGYRYVVVNDLLGEVFARQYNREDILKLREFIDGHLELLHSANRVTLYRIR
jgi:hypothetical protein